MGRTIKARILLIAIACAGLLAAAAPALAGVSWRLDGAGYGHGVGMSQYGARGYAAHGAGWREILAHYFRGTRIGTVKPTSIRVLLEQGTPSAAFSGVDLACGLRLDPSKTYEAVPGGSGVKLLRVAGKRGHQPRDCGSLLTATGPGIWNLGGKGAYRGALQLRPGASGGLDAVDWVGIEDYVRGVVPSEVPSSWPQAALRAQAVAARSYALSGGDAGSDFDVYDDTRSQVYGGAGAETPRTDRAVDATSLDVVLAGSQIARTYFFSTSGGHTEDVQNIFGGPPVSYLQGVPDPYDGASRYHRWTETFSEDAMQSALSGLVKGQLEQIRITKVGASPRIISADLIGSGGTTSVSGETLQSRLGLRDRWVSFHKIDPDAARRYRRRWSAS